MISKIIQSIKLYLHRKEKFYGLSISEWGFVPGNKGLYTLALLHKSASRYTKSGTVLNYERLEFLGDAVLGAIVAEILYKFFPNKDEGFMTRLLCKNVSRKSLNIITIKIDYGKEESSSGDGGRFFFCGGNGIGGGAERWRRGRQALKVWHRPVNPAEKARWAVS